MFFTSKFIKTDENETTRKDEALQLDRMKMTENHLVR